jgi:hypothetical protein
MPFALLHRLYSTCGVYQECTTAQKYPNLARKVQVAMPQRRLLRDQPCMISLQRCSVVPSSNNPGMLVSPVALSPCAEQRPPSTQSCTSSMIAILLSNILQDPYLGTARSLESKTTLQTQRNATTKPSEFRLIRIVNRLTSKTFYQHCES